MSLAFHGPLDDRKWPVTYFFTYAHIFHIVTYAHSHIGTSHIFYNFIYLSSNQQKSAHIYADQRNDDIA